MSGGTAARAASSDSSSEKHGKTMLVVEVSTHGEAVNWIIPDMS